MYLEDCDSDGQTSGNFVRRELLGGMVGMFGPEKKCLKES